MFIKNSGTLIHILSNASKIKKEQNPVRTIIMLLHSFTKNDFCSRKKPKVALVLSGGGAKGIAYISTLQVLDSLHIVPDLIVGTSMGSIVGGLYAMGYSGDSIASLAKNV